MTLTSRGVVLLALLHLAGCATPQLLHVPKTESPVNHGVGSSSLVEQTNYMLRHLDQKKSILYLQNFGGGGVGLGVLLGPLGVAANIKMIEGVTDEDVAMLNGKLPIDPQNLFESHANGLATLNQGASATTKKPVVVTPYFYVSKTDGEQLLMASALIVDYGPTGLAWQGRYMYQLPLKFSKDDVAKGLTSAQLDHINREATEGFRVLSNFYVEDRKGALGEGQEITFKSDFVTPRILIELIGQQLPGKGDRVNIRTVGAVYSLPKDSVQVFKK